MKAMLQDTSMPSCTCASTHTHTYTHTHTRTHARTHTGLQPRNARRLTRVGTTVRRADPDTIRGLKKDPVCRARTFQQQPVSSVEAVLLARSDTRGGRKDQLSLTAAGLLWKGGL